MDNDLEVPPGGDRHHPEHSIPTMVGTVVDRAVELWEFWMGGGVILDTPLINIFYFLMGAKIHITAQHRTFGFVRSFVREFDLVEILVKECASIQHPIKCRKFGEWHGMTTKVRLYAFNLSPLENEVM
jgi:hypothetical protein